MKALTSTIQLHGKEVEILINKEYSKEIGKGIQEDLENDYKSVAEFKRYFKLGYYGLFGIIVGNPNYKKDFLQVI